MVRLGHHYPGSTTPDAQRHLNFFSGNGIAVAAMCAALHEHGPPTVDDGGGSPSLRSIPRNDSPWRLCGDLVTLEGNGQKTL